MEKNKLLEMDDAALEAVSGGKLTKNAYQVMQWALGLAKDNNMSKQEVLDMLNKEWAKKNAVIKMVTTDFSQADYDACIAFLNENW